MATDRVCSADQDSPSALMDIATTPAVPVLRKRTQYQVAGATECPESLAVVPPELLATNIQVESARLLEHPAEEPYRSHSPLVGGKAELIAVVCRPTYICDSVISAGVLNFQTMVQLVAAVRLGIDFDPLVPESSRPAAALGVAPVESV